MTTRMAILGLAAMLTVGLGAQTAKAFDIDVDLDFGGCDRVYYAPARPVIYSDCGPVVYRSYRPAYYYDDCGPVVYRSPRIYTRSSVYYAPRHHTSVYVRGGHHGRVYYRH